jgi:hypothetical protein
VIRFQRTMAFGAALAMAGCAAPAPPELLAADGVERVAVDRAAFRGELAAFRTSAFTLGDALLAGGGDGNVVASPGSLLIALACCGQVRQGMPQRRWMPCSGSLMPAGTRP